MSSFVSRSETQVQATFWGAVEDCLVLFHGFTADDAFVAVNGLKERLRSEAWLDASEPTAETMIYHAEPWYLACDLAKRDLDVTEHLALYQSVLAGYSRETQSRARSYHFHLATTDSLRRELQM
jgi:hypothetical protein